MAEGGGFLARDAPLGEQAKDLSESAVNSRRGSEVAAGGMELGKVEYGADDVTSGCRVAEQLFFSFSVKAAAGGMDFGARHAALAAIGERELATIGQDIFIDDRIIVCNGDGSMLMNLGSLVTITAAGAKNLVVIVLDNGVYEVTGAEPTPGSAAGRRHGGAVDFSEVARGSGFESVHYFSRGAGESKHSKGFAQVVKTGLRMMRTILRKRFARGVPPETRARAAGLAAPGRTVI